MIRISPAPPLPYTPGAKYKYRRADIAPAEDVTDMAEENSGFARDEDGELPSSVPVPTRGGRIVDAWV